MLIFRRPAISSDEEMLKQQRSQHSSAGAAQTLCGRRALFLSWHVLLFGFVEHGNATGRHQSQKCNDPLFVGSVLSALENMGLPSQTQDTEPMPRG